MGVLANHVPSIEQLKPGLLEIFTEGGNKEEYFVAGGFAIVQPGSKLSVNVTEAYKLEEFSREAITSNLQEAQRLATGGGSEEDVAEAKIQVEVSDDFCKRRTVLRAKDLWPQSPHVLRTQARTLIPSG